MFEIFASLLAAIYGEAADVNEERVRVRVEGVATFRAYPVNGPDTGVVATETVYPSGTRVRSLLSTQVAEQVAAKVLAK